MTSASFFPPQKKKMTKAAAAATSDTRRARAIKIAEEETRIGAKREIERSINRNRLRREREIDRGDDNRRAAPEVFARRSRHRKGVSEIVNLTENLENMPLQLQWVCRS